MSVFVKIYIFSIYSLLIFNYYAVCRISNKRKCVVEDCNVPISQATTLVRYIADDKRLLSFSPRANAIVFSKEAGDNPSFWEIEIKGKRGYAPKTFLRENKVFVKSSEVKIVVSTGRDEMEIQNMSKTKPYSTDVDRTPELPAANSKGFFSMMGGVSADSVPPSSPDIKADSTSKFQILDGTTVYGEPSDETMGSPVIVASKIREDSIVDLPYQVETKYKEAKEKSTEESFSGDIQTDSKSVEGEIRNEDVFKNDMNLPEIEKELHDNNLEEISKIETNSAETAEINSGSSLFGEIVKGVSNLISSGSGPDEEEKEYEDEESIGEDENSEVDEMSYNEGTSVKDTSSNLFVKETGGNTYSVKETIETEDSTYSVEETKLPIEKTSLSNLQFKPNVSETGNIVNDLFKSAIRSSNNVEQIKDLKQNPIEENDIKPEVSSDFNKYIFNKGSTNVIHDVISSTDQEKSNDILKTGSDYSIELKKSTNPVSTLTTPVPDANEAKEPVNEKETLEIATELVMNEKLNNLQPDGQQNKIEELGEKVQEIFYKESNISSDSQVYMPSTQPIVKEANSDLLMKSIIGEDQSKISLEIEKPTDKESEATLSFVVPDVEKSDTPQSLISSINFIKDTLKGSEVRTAGVNQLPELQTDQDSIASESKSPLFSDISTLLQHSGELNIETAMFPEEKNNKGIFEESTKQDSTEPLLSIVPASIEHETTNKDKSIVEIVEKIANLDPLLTSYTSERIEEVINSDSRDPSLPTTELSDLVEEVTDLESEGKSLSTSELPEIEEGPHFDSKDKPSPRMESPVVSADGEIAVEIVKRIDPVESSDGFFGWFNPVFDLFRTQETKQENNKIDGDDDTPPKSEYMDLSKAAYPNLADESCIAEDLGEGACKPLGYISTASKDISWQESLYSSTNVEATLDLFDKIPVETTVWLIVTAVVVLIFSLGHYYIEAHRRDGPLVAIINKLEREVLILKKETCIQEDRLSTAQQQLEAWNTSSSENDALIVELKQELEEAKASKAELEDQVAVLEKEVESVTENGLEIHRMLEESLSSQDGSQVLLSTVETLREKLERQEEEITGLSQSLSQKKAEVEELQKKLLESAEVANSLEDRIVSITRDKDEEALQLKDKHHQLMAQLEEAIETKALDETRVSAEMSRLRLTIEELQKTMAEKDLELEEVKEVVKQLRSTDSNDKIDALFDVVGVRAQLKSVLFERDDFRERFLEEEGARKLLEGHMKKITQEVADLKNSFETAEKEKIEALTKLQVLSNYFKEKESQLQKELGLQESMWLQKQSDDHTIYEQMRSLREENEKYKLQNESLKKEIVEQESSFKIQLANVEQKAHENWVGSRQAERRLKEAQQEAAQLRNRLTMEKHSANYSLEDTKQTISESNGDPSSPPPSLMFPPTTSPPFMLYPMPPPGDFVPPPPLMGSPYPSDSRPPPLGRISSPPLDPRFSPPPPLPYPPYDYPSYGHHSPSPPPPMPQHPHHRNVHKPQPRDISREQKDQMSNYSPESEKSTRRNKR